MGCMIASIIIKNISIIPPMFPRRSRKLETYLLFEPSSVETTICIVKYVFILSEILFLGLILTFSKL